MNKLFVAIMVGLFIKVANNLLKYRRCKYYLNKYENWPQDKNRGFLENKYSILKAEFNL